MPKLHTVKGTGSKLCEVFVQDTSRTDGGGLTGLLFNTSGLSAYYYREGAAVATVITLQTMTVGTWASGGFIAVDGTNLPGVYQLGLPNAALLTGANSVIVMLKGAANMAPVLLEIQLTDVDVNDAIRFGMTALPNAAPNATGGLAAPVAHGGTAQAGTATTVTLAAGASATTDIYKGMVVDLVGGTGAPQCRTGTAYNGTTKVLTVDRAWATNPDATSVYSVRCADEATKDASLAVTAGTVGDKTGYSLAVGAVDAAQFTQAAADKVWTSAARTLTAFAQGFSDQVWTTTSRTLTAFAQGFSDQVWTSASRTLTAFAQGFADQVWASAARTLTAFSQTFSDQTWASAARSLTAFSQAFSDQVWSTAARTLTAFGFGVTVTTNNDKTGYSLAVAPPTAAQIDTQLSGTHGSGQWGIGLGTGANLVTVTVQSTGLTPLQGVSVTIKNQAQTAIVATGTTDVNGQIGFNLNNGTYAALILSTPSYVSPAPQTLVVSGTTAATYTLVVFNPGTPVSASLCRVFGTLRNADGTAAVGQTVSFTLVPFGPWEANDTAVLVSAIAVTTDSNGYFQADLTRSNQFVPVSGVGTPSYLVTNTAAHLHHTFTAPNQSSADLFSLVLTPA